MTTRDDTASLMRKPRKDLVAIIHSARFRATEANERAQELSRVNNEHKMLIAQLEARLRSAEYNATEAAKQETVAMRAMAERQRELRTANEELKHWKEIAKMRKQRADCFFHAAGKMRAAITRVSNMLEAASESVTLSTNELAIVRAMVETVFDEASEEYAYALATAEKYPDPEDKETPC